MSHLPPEPHGSSLRISAWAIRNPIPVVVLFIGLVLAGMIAYGGLAVKNFPDVTFPAVSVTITQSGAAPGEIETQITRQVEDAVARAQQLDEMSARRLAERYDAVRIPAARLGCTPHPIAGGAHIFLRVHQRHAGRVRRQHEHERVALVLQRDQAVVRNERIVRQHRARRDDLRARELRPAQMQECASSSTRIRSSGPANVGMMPRLAR